MWRGLVAKLYGGMPLQPEVYVRGGGFLDLENIPVQYFSCGILIVNVLTLVVAAATLVVALRRK